MLVSSSTAFAKDKSKPKGKAKPPAAAPAVPDDDAAPAPLPDEPVEEGENKQDARSLMASGIKLLQAKDYRGALAVFKDAYQRYPSAKILLNIGTTLKTMGRTADAANAYQKYLDSDDTDPARQQEIVSLIGSLDSSLARLAITVSPAEAEVMIADGDWISAREARMYRIEPGTVSIRGRSQGFISDDVEATGSVGTTTEVSLTLKPRPTETKTVIKESGPGRLSGQAHLLVDAKLRGAAGAVGIGFAVTNRIHVAAAAILGGTPGVMPSAQVHLTTSKLRPYLGLGIPVFFSDGARVSLRPSAGVLMRVGKRLEFILEAAVDRALNPEDDIDKWTIVPAAGAHVRF